ncbi:MAG: aminomethyl transferase family protein [Gemmatimonadetes bacterium]|nr:aminomethyl transferase family protein [Gemmatimonadota bacterium]MYB07910.1 aminomethyl transferase family protein [Gemmatimonadota bacterium]MYE17953.1 aminomethyl transferase family protein [Gemmatimonadota bacterium]MYG24332.1 aminomethyl transferase family protein [Gemmatimonadota bacterium]MYJ39110.1 aminomethyl transferase family protein [Gemmatimonadota bacterium]
MLLETPFHLRTTALCRSRRWRNWSGYAAALSYEPGHEYEYYAVRSGAALFDISPLRKYEVTGADAAALVDRLVTRNVFCCAEEQVLYTPWCDEAGKLIDDGTVQRLGADMFRITAADPCLRWFQDCGLGMDAAVRDVTLDLAALALQGPTSRDILARLVTGADIAALPYFALAEGHIGAAPVTITRTGYTGDLGYEIWLAPEHALAVWDALVETGRGFGLAPAGLDALDVARIEAGLLLKEVDYVSSWTALIESRKSSPYEAGLGWTVQPRPSRDFVGQKALEREAATPSEWALAGLEADWPGIEKRFAAVGLPPLVAGRASRDAVPIYAGAARQGGGAGRQIGYITSATFSPILKKYIALATIRRDFAEQGSRIEVELTVEFVRHRVPARVVGTPFFDPARKRG